MTQIGRAAAALGGDVSGRDTIPDTHRKADTIAVKSATGSDVRVPCRLATRSIGAAALTSNVSAGNMPARAQNVVATIASPPTLTRMFSIVGGAVPKAT
jgi:hypothetical protein